MKTVAAIVVCCLLALIPSTPGACFEQHAYAPTTEAEQRLWHLSAEAVAALEHSNRLYQDPPLQTYLKRVVEHLRQATAETRMPFSVRVLIDHQLDAFSYPNGECFIHTGLLARLENEAQLALLLAHEMVHVFNRHALNTYRHIFASVGNSNEIPRTSLQARRFRGSWFQYRDEAEVEADREGIKLIVAAGYDPDDAIGLFNLLLNEFENGTAQRINYDHARALMPQRIDACQSFLGTVADQAIPVQTDPVQFNAILRPTRLMNIRLDLKVGRMASARYSAQKLTSHHPRDPIPYYLLGEIYRRQATAEGVSKAKAYYLKAIDLNAEYPDPYRALGLVYYRAGDKGTAKDLFQICLALAPEAPENTYIRHYLSQCQF